MGTKLTKEIVNERLSERPIQLVGEYVGTGTKSKFACDDCGGEWMAKPDSVMQGTGCPHCAGNVPLTKEIVNERLKERPVQLIGKYVNAITKSKFACHDCGGEWMATPSDVMVGNGCPHCAGNIRLSRSAVNERLEERTVRLVGDYVTSSTKTRFYCEICGGEWMARPKDVMKGSGCTRCPRPLRLSKEIVNKRLEGRSVRLIGDYRGTQSKTKIACDDCGGEWKTTPNHVMRGRGCPYCSGKANLSLKVTRRR